MPLPMCIPQSFVSLCNVSWHRGTEYAESNLLEKIREYCVNSYWQQPSISTALSSSGLKEQSVHIPNIYSDLLLPINDFCIESSLSRWLTHFLNDFPTKKLLSPMAFVPQGFQPSPDMSEQQGWTWLQR